MGNESKEVSKGACEVRSGDSKDSRYNRSRESEKLDKIYKIPHPHP